MHLVIDRWGLYLGKSSERLVLKEKGKVIEEYPLFDLEQVTVASRGISLSTDIIQECIKRGINIHFVAFDGRPYACIQSPQLGGTIQTRRAQLRAYDTTIAIEISKAFVQGKIRNQINVLKYFAKYRKEKEPLIFQDVEFAIESMKRMLLKLSTLAGNHIEELRNSIMSAEALAAKAYWNAVGKLIDKNVSFEGREQRGAADPFNSLLNYGYAILLSQAWSALSLAGLDPFGGFLHVDRPGKPSLVLDFMEEFRPQIIDRVAIAYVTRGRPLNLEEGRLNEETRREYVKAVMERLDSKGRFEKEKVRLQAVIYRQARHLATTVRGERKYVPFVDSW